MNGYIEDIGKNWYQQYAANPDTPDNIILGNNNLTYCNGANARDELINIKGWTIIDDGIDSNCN